jgi:hypothetical protein
VPNRYVQLKITESVSKVRKRLLLTKTFFRVLLSGITAFSRELYLETAFREQEKLPTVIPDAEHLRLVNLQYLKAWKMK